MLIFLQAAIWRWEMFTLLLSESLLIVPISLYVPAPVGEVSVSARVFLFFFHLPRFFREAAIMQDK